MPDTSEPPACVACADHQRLSPASCIDDVAAGSSLPNRHASLAGERPWPIPHATSSICPIQVAHRT